MNKGSIVVCYQVGNCRCIWNIPVLLLIFVTVAVVVSINLLCREAREYKLDNDYLKKKNVFFEAKIDKRNQQNLAKVLKCFIV